MSFNARHLMPFNMTHVNGIEKHAIHHTLVTGTLKRRSAVLLNACHSMTYVNGIE